MIKRVVRRIAPSLSVKHATTADEVVVTFADGAITTVTYAYQQSTLAANLPGAGCGASGRATSG